MSKRLSGFKFAHLEFENPRFPFGAKRLGKRICDLFYNNVLIQEMDLFLGGMNVHIDRSRINAEAVFP